MAGRIVISDDEDENEIDVEEDEGVGGARDTESVDDSGEEEEDGQDEYEKDGFIVDEMDEEQQDEEEQKEDIDKEKHKKNEKWKKRGSKKNYVLDEDDYELLQDNNVIGFHRPKPERKNFKRLKKAGRDSKQEEQSVFWDDEKSDISSQSGWTSEEKLRLCLFGDDGGTPLEEIAEDKGELEEEDDICEEDEMADFIVDEEIDKTGAPLRGKPSKKKLSKAAGFSSIAIREARDIFGDVDALLMKRTQSLVKAISFVDSTECNVKSVEDEFEPFIIAEKYMTIKDDQIRDIDVPERIQLLKEIVGPVPTDDKSIEEESAWIYKQLTLSYLSPFSGNMHLIGGIKKEEIGNVLAMLHVQKLDIPFISMYRKELCLSLLKDPEQDVLESEAERTCTLKWHKKLWAIQNLDRKWLVLRKRKTALQLYYNKRFQEETRRLNDETKLTLNRQIFKSVIESLKVSASEREVDDVDLKFNLHFPPDEVVVEEGKFKRPTRKSLYNICCKAGLWKVVCKFGVSSEQFGLLLNLEKMRVDELEDLKETPDEIAANFTCAMFNTTEAVLQGARHMGAVEISSEPCVRKHVRSIFMENATVSTRPTTDGDRVIDSLHHLFGMKWLCDKPLSKFTNEKWLLIQKSEEEKLLEVIITLPESVQSKLMSDAKDCYVSDGVSRSALLWNEQRELILKDAFFKFLLPSMEKEARSLLTTRSKNWLRMEYGKQLWEKVSVAPYQQKESDAGPNNGVAPRVIACCWGLGEPGTTFVMLDSSGELLDVLHLRSISVRSQSVTEQQRKKNDEQRLVKFVTDHQPHVVVVGAVNLYSTRLKDDIFEIIYNLVEKNPKEDGESMSEMSIVYGGESLPRLYENSQISSDQLTGQTGIVKRAVALGRYLQNPLCMIATLCGPGREILSWKLNRLEHLLSPDEKYGMVEQVMIDATNQVGIDINLAASHEWLFAPLQFVSGLGPRKASVLQRALVRVGAVFNRKDIAMNVLKKKVFINAVGFLRVRWSGLATTSSRIIDLLDDTRIHPESYHLAKNMAKDINDEDAQGQPYDMDEDAQEMAIEHIRDKPMLLKVLDIQEYFKSVEARVQMKKVETLSDIKMELLHGFQEWRSPYREPNPEEVFYMISSETKENLIEGRIVQATVCRVHSERLICELGSGLTGVIFKEDFSDSGDVDLAEKVIEGSRVTCKIKLIQKNRYQVLLTCKESELCKHGSQSSEDQDPYNDEEKGKLQIKQDKCHKEGRNSWNELDKGRNEEKGNLQNEQEKGCQEFAKKLFKPRLILHPCFQNFSDLEATQFLSDKDPGEYIIHPSSRGPTYLTLTLKVYDGIYSHKDIVESRKDETDITSLLRLGKTLKIGEDAFEDLDEVIDHYVDPLLQYLKAMLGYHKFRTGSRAEVDELLRMEKAEHPMRIVYFFGVSYEHPGAFILSYIRSTNPRHEFIGLSHNGFKFRKQMFAGNNSIDKLVAFFQGHIGDLRPSNQSLAAMVPMRSSGAKGSSGRGSASDDWDGNDCRDGDGRGVHPSWVPRPHGQGLGQTSCHEKENNSGNERQDSGFASSKRASVLKVGDNDLSSFLGAKDHNSPGREAFPGGWGSNGDGDGIGIRGNWRTGGNGNWKGGGFRNDGSGEGNNWGSNLGANVGGGRGKSVDSEGGGNGGWGRSKSDHNEGVSSGVWGVSGSGGHGGWERSTGGCNEGFRVCGGEAGGNGGGGSGAWGEGNGGYSSGWGSGGYSGCGGGPTNGGGRHDSDHGGGRNNRGRGSRGGHGHGCRDKCIDWSGGSGDGLGDGDGGGTSGWGGGHTSGSGRGRGCGRGSGAWGEGNGGYSSGWGSGGYSGCGGGPTNGGGQHDSDHGGGGNNRGRGSRGGHGHGCRDSGNDWSGGSGDGLGDGDGGGTSGWGGGHTSGSGRGRGRGRGHRGGRGRDCKDDGGWGSDRHGDGGGNGGGRGGSVGWFGDDSGGQGSGGNNRGRGNRGRGGRIDSPSAWGGGDANCKDNGGWGGRGGGRSGRGRGISSGGEGGSTSDWGDKDASKDGGGWGGSGSNDVRGWSSCGGSGDWGNNVSASDGWDSKDAGNTAGSGGWVSKDANASGASWRNSGGNGWDRSGGDKIVAGVRGGWGSSGGRGSGGGGGDGGCWARGASGGQGSDDWAGGNMASGGTVGWGDDAGGRRVGGSRGRGGGRSWDSAGSNGSSISGPGAASSGWNGSGSSGGTRPGNGEGW